MNQKDYINIVTTDQLQYGIRDKTVNKFNLQNVQKCRSNSIAKNLSE